MDINTHMLMGRLGRDPDVRDLPSGGIVANFSVATNKSYPKRNADGEFEIDPETQKRVMIERTAWTRIVAWNSAAKTAQKFLKKGYYVHIMGEVQTRSWEDSEGVKRFVTETVVGIFGTRLDLMPNGNRADRVEDQPDFPEAVPDDDIPF